MPARNNFFTSFSIQTAKLWKNLRRNIRPVALTAGVSSRERTGALTHVGPDLGQLVRETTSQKSTISPTAATALAIPTPQFAAQSVQNPSAIGRSINFIASVPVRAAKLDQNAATCQSPETTKESEEKPKHCFQVLDTLENYLLALKHNNCSPATIRNYKSDIKQFFDFTGEDNLKIILTKPKLTAFLKNQQAKGLQPATIKRKLISIAQFSLWAKRGKLLGNPELPSGLSQATEQELLTLIESHQVSDATPTSLGTKNTKPNKKPQADIVLPTLMTAAPLGKVGTIIPYLNLGLIALFLLGLGYFGFRQFQNVDQSLAFPTTLTRPNRVLSFQGRLTDQADNPIVAGTAMRFRLFNNITGGTQLWDSNACTVDPDVDGIFNASLGAGSGGGSDDDDCGAEIPSSVFTENSNVWLQVTIGSETLSPRQPIRTVAYALNSETLQGFPASASAVENTVLIMNNSGEVVLGNANPQITSTGDTFTLEGEAVTIQTTTGSNSDITLNSERNIIFDAGIGGTGGSLISRDYLSAPGATLSATYAGGTALTLKAGPSATGDIMRWQTDGGTTLGVINAGGDVGIGTNLPEQKLTVSDNIQLGVTDSTRYIYFDNGTGSNSGLRYNSSTDKMQFSHDGVTWSDFLDTTGVVTSVSNADGTLTISPTTGAVVASLNLGNANTWTGLQTFNNTYTDFAQYLRHEGDTNTFIEFTPDVIDLNAGGKNVLSLDVLAPQDLVTIGDGTDIDTQILTDSNTVGLFVEGSSGRVGIGGVTTPAAALEIGGSGTIRVGGLSASLPVKTNANKDLVSGAIDLASAEVTGVLPITNGGTNSTATPTNGGVAYGDGTGYAFTGAGTSGYVLRSNGASAPTWADPNSLITNYWTRSAQGIVSPSTLNDGVAATSSATTVLTATQQNTSLLAARIGGTTDATSVVIDGNGQLGIGDVTPANKFTVGTNSEFQVNSSGAIAAATGITSSGNITFSGLSGGTTDSVIIENSGLLQTRTIDSRVWGSSLIDGSGTTNYVTYWSDANTLAAEQYLATSRGGLGGDVTAAGAGELLYSTGTTTYDSLAAGTSGYVLRSNGAAAPSWVDVNTLVGQYWSRSAQGVISPTTLNDVVAATSSATTVLTATQQNSSLLAARIGGTTDATSVVIDGNGQLGVGDITPGNKFTVGTNSEFQVNASGAIAAATGITSSGNITFSGLSGGSTDSVIIENSGLLQTRTIDSRVWGSSLVDGSGTTNYVTYWSDANTLAAEQYLATSRGGVGGDVTAAGAGELIYSTGATTYDSLAAGTSGYVLRSNGAAAPSWVDVNTLVGQYWSRSAQGIVSPSTLNDGVAATSSATTVLTATQQNSSLLAARIGGTTDATSVVIDGNGQLGVGDVTPANKFTVGTNSEFQINSSGAIAAATGITSSGNISFTGLAGGTTDTVLIQSAGNVMQTRTIDSRVWGSSLVDGSGTTNYVTYWSDANTLAAEQYLATSRGGLGGDVTAAGAGELIYSTGATTYDSLASGTSGYLLQSSGAGAPTWVSPSTVFTNHWTRSVQGIVSPTVLNDGVAATSSATTVLTATQQNASLLAARLGGTTNYATVDANGNLGFTNAGGSTITSSAGLSIDGSGAITVGGTNATSTTIGRAAVDTTVNGNNIVLGSQANATNEAVRADRSLTITQEGSGNVTITNSGSAQDLTADRSWTLGWTGQLAATRGGTGFGSYAVGDLLYADTTTSLAKLAGVASGNVLLSGGVSTAPSWGKVGLTTHVSGILPIANGGTNSNATLSNGRVMVSSGGSIVERAALSPTTLLVGNATTGLAPIAAGDGTSGQVLISGGPGVEPSWSSSLPAGTNISFTNITSGTNTSATMVVGTGASLNFSGSGTINASTLLGGTWASPGAIGSTTPNTGAFTTLSANSTVTFSSLGAGSTDTVVTQSAGNVLQTRTIDSRVWGSSLVDGSGTTNYVTYWSDANTLAAEQYLATSRGGLGGNVTAAGAGEILYSTSTTAYDSLASGTSGYVLRSNGAGAPSWVDVNTLTNNYWTRSAQGIVSPVTTNDGVAATSSATTVLTATQQNASLLAARIGGTTDATSLVVGGDGEVGVGTVNPAGKLDVTDTSNTAASLILTNNTATTIGAGANTLGVLDLQSTSLTTGNFLNIEANALTTGRGINLTTTSTGLTSGGLIRAVATGNPGTSWTGTLGLFEYNTSTDIDIDGSALTIGITGAGAGDGTALNVTTGQTGTNALALRVNDDGTYTDSTPFVIDASGNVGVGDASPTSLLTVGSGDLFQVNSSGAIAAATGITSSGNISFTGLAGGTTDTVLIQSAGNVMQTRTIDSRVWGSSLVDGSGTTNYVTYWSDANTLAAEQYLATSRGGLGNTVTAAGAGEILYSTSTTAYDSLAAGTSSFVLRSNGAAAPSWVDVNTLVTNYWTRSAQGIVSPVTTNDGVAATSSATTVLTATQQNASLLAARIGGTTDATSLVVGGDGEVGIGTITPAGKLDITDTSNTAASLSLTNNTATTIGAGANTLGVLDLQTTSLTTGNFLNIETNALTTGRAFNLSSTSTAITSASLFNVTASGSPATSWTGNLGLFEYQTSTDIDIDGSALKVGITGAGGGDGIALNVTTAQTGTNALALRVNDDGTYTDSTPVIIDANGNVAIGATSAGAKLDITDTSNTAASLTLTNNTATTIGAGANTLGVLDLQSTSLTTGNFINIETNALTSGKAFNITTTSTGLTTGSIFNLEALGNPGASWTGNVANIEYDGGNDADIDGNALVVGIPGAGGGDGTALNITSGQTGASSFVFRANDDGSYTDSTPTAITTAGDVGIGTTTPQRKLHILIGGNAPPVRIEDTNGYCEINPTSTTWTCTSDARLKKDVASLTTTNSLALIDALNAVTFRWNKETSSAQKHFGFIAQEVETIIPSMVNTDETGIKTVDYGAFTPLLVSAIQAVNDKTDQLTQQVTNNQLTLSQYGEINLSVNLPTAEAIVTDSQNNPINRYAAYTGAIVGKLQAGIISTRSLLAEVITATTATFDRTTTRSLEVTEDITARDVAITNEVTTNKLTATTSKLGGLLAETATISGNLSVTGKTALGSLTSTSLTVTSDATISGDLTITGTASAAAGRIAYIESKLAQLETVKAQTAELTIATVSGTLYANNIADFDAKVAQTFRQPSLLANLLNQDNLPTDLDLPATATSANELKQTLADLNLSDSDIVITPAALFIKDYFETNGNGFIAGNLGIGKQLVIGNGLIISQNSIAYQPATMDENTVFSIQPAGRGKLALLGGILQISEGGLVEISGDLWVAGDITTLGKVTSDGDVNTKGTLASNTIKPFNNDEALQVKVADQDSESGEVKRSRFEIVDELGTPVATISADGTAKFSSLSVDSENITATGSGTLNSSQAAGRAKLTAGQTEIIIKSERINANSLIYVTPLSSTNNQVLYVKAQIAEDTATGAKEGEFRVGLDTPIGTDVEFNWWIVN